MIQAYLEKNKDTAEIECRTGFLKKFAVVPSFLVESSISIHALHHYIFGEGSDEESSAYMLLMACAKYSFA